MIRTSFFATLASVAVIFFFLRADGKEDKYANFAELAAKEVLGKDYKIEVKKASSPISILAPHGGRIELETELIARGIAADNFNYYGFLGIKPKGNRRLHITSKKFDEPKALKLVSESALCLSVHGFGKSKKEEICFGGSRKDLQEKLFREMQAKGLLTQKELNPCGRFYGTHPKNIVNRCSQGGVQLEMSYPLRKRLITDNAFGEKLYGVIRNTLKAAEASAR